MHAPLHFLLALYYLRPKMIIIHSEQREALLHTENFETLNIITTQRKSR